MSEPTRPPTYYTIFAPAAAVDRGDLAGRLLPLGAWNTVPALAIAVVKATLVLLFFMHLKNSSA